MQQVRTLGPARAAAGNAAARSAGGARRAAGTACALGRGARRVGLTRCPLLLPANPPFPPTPPPPLYSCPSGYETRVGGTGASSCTMCQPGYFASAPNTAFCSPCAPATFAPTPGAKTCKLCNAGEVTGPLPGDPKAGGAGMNATRCTPCGRRTFRPSIYAANTCTRCPAGRETKRAQGATVCTACIPGTTLLTATDFSCTSCGAGRWLGSCGACASQSNPAQPAHARLPACLPVVRTDPSPLPRPCRLHPAGSFSQSPGTSGTCPLCSPGSFVSDYGNAQCDPCPPGGCAEPQLCRPAGREAPTRRSARWPLAAPPMPSHACLPPSPRPRRRPRAPRPAGSFQNVTGALSCIECPAGTYSSMTGSTDLEDCLPAPRGNYAEGTGNDGFVPCPAGTYQDLPGQGACKVGLRGACGACAAAGRLATCRWASSSGASSLGLPAGHMLMPSSGADVACTWLCPPPPFAAVPGGVCMPAGQCDSQAVPRRLLC